MATSISTTFVQWRRTTSSTGEGSQYSDNYIRLGSGSGYTYTGYTQFTLPEQASNITVKYVGSESGSNGYTYYGLLTQEENIYAKVALGLSVNVNGTTVTLTPSVTSTMSSYNITFSINGNFAPGTYYFYTWGSNQANGFVKFAKTSCSLTYTAQTRYSVTYNANGGTGVPEEQTKWEGFSLTLSSVTPTKAETTSDGPIITFDANGGTSTKTNETAINTINYSFSHWNTSSAGDGVSYQPGSSYTQNSDVILYAQYNSNVTKGSVTMPSITECTRDGYILQGFSEDGNEIKYNAGGSYVFNENTTVYAIWANDSNNRILVKHNGSIVSPSNIYVKLNGVITPVSGVYTKLEGTIYLLQ